MGQNTKRVCDLFGRYRYCDCSVTVWGFGWESSEGGVLKPPATKVRCHLRISYWWTFFSIRCTQRHTSATVFFVRFNALGKLMPYGAIE